ncbi:MAG: hypothetical protein ACLRXC_11085 [[Clostridium] leptum]
MLSGRRFYGPGFLYSYLTYGDYSGHFAGDCAGATAFHPGLATRRDIEELIILLQYKEGETKITDLLNPRD